MEKAFYGVYSSSKEIIKNKQRHLYVNMLDLLERTCKTTGLAEGSIEIDDLVQFWLGDIFPLVFDPDNSIQTCAIKTMEQGLSLLERTKLQSSKHWPELRQVFISEYPQKIHKLRETKNTHWHEIWCLVIEILDREILKGASVINSFLSVVELGFRSSDSSVRAEAFYCWRLLIKIFFTYDELLTPKRLKLICIPFKSSQSKSLQSANIKMRVWWYFIVCIGQHLREHFENCVEPFLSFVFGSEARSMPGTIQQYNSLLTTAIVCLVQLLNIEEKSDEFIEHLIAEENLEVFEPLPSPLMGTDILTKYWKPITNATIGAIRTLCAVNDDDENYDLSRRLINILLLRLMKMMTLLNLAECTKNIFDELVSLLSKDQYPLKTALSFIASNGVVETTTGLTDLENYALCMKSFLNVLISAKQIIAPAIFQHCIEQFTKSIQAFQGDQKWRAICALIKIVCSSTDNDDYMAFETKLLFWRNLSQIILNYLAENNLSYRRKDFAEVVNDFILWPLRHFSSFAGRNQITCFDNDFCASWRQLVLAGQNAPDRINFLENLKNILLDFGSNNRPDLPLPELFDAYAAAIMKLTTSIYPASISEFFSLFQQIIALPQQACEIKCLEKYLNTFRHFLAHLKNQEVVNHMEQIKTTIAHVIKMTQKERTGGSKFIDEWKQGILEIFRTQPQKNLLSQIREVFKKSDVFVIIPSVWMLNPDKLTERQKERFAERSDIPALYNDLSQSQDSSIKPWTPKKIVIAKQNETEIAIGSDNLNSNVDCKETPNCKLRRDDNGDTEKRTLRSNNTKQQQENTIESNNLKSSKQIEDKNESELVDNSEVYSGIRKSLRSQKTESAEKSEISGSDEKLIDKSKQINKRTDMNPDKLISLGDAIADTQTPPKSKRVYSQEPQASIQSGQSITRTVVPLLKDVMKTQSEGERKDTHVIVIESESEKPSDSEVPENLHTPIIETNQNNRESSPKKSSTRIASLSSPPDRKSTNNTCSPSVRPKPTPLTGRGAQLINMIRSKMKVDNTTSTPSSRSNIFHTQFEKRESTPVPENAFEVAATMDHTSTPVQSDFLTFTKRLPSPTASPSASILKRKLRRESLDETPIESPASKRKKVSFHDPPVSVTKEYLKDVEETNTKLKRCLTLDKFGIGKMGETKHALKRRSKLMMDNFTSDQAEKEDLTESFSNCEAKRLPLPKDNITDKSCSDQNLVNEHSNTDFSTESMPNTEAALSVVIQDCSLETVLEKYFSDEKAPSSKDVNTLVKFMSKLMEANSKTKSNILGILSENHSKDFLDHAIQENLSSVVCDRLNLNSVLEYICAKSKLNSNCLRNLLSEIPDLLKHCKTDGEPVNFIKTLIESLNPSDDVILDLIAVLMRIRNDRQSSSTPYIESADVSSSNL